MRAKGGMVARLGDARRDGRVERQIRHVELLRSIRRDAGGYKGTSSKRWRTLRGEMQAVIKVRVASAEDT